MIETTTQLCTCGQPAPESAYICEQCIDDLWRALRKVPAYVSELEVTLTRQRRFETQTSSARSAVDELPYNVAASLALDRLRDTLTLLVRSCLASHVPSSDYLDRSPGKTPASMSAWLLWRVDGIAAQPWARRALDVERALQRAERVIDRPAERSYAGPCDRCGRDLYARKGKTSVSCVDCELTYDLSARRAWLLNLVDDRLATASEIARALTSFELPVTAERIWQWRHRERIEVRGHDARQRPLYRVGDVVALLNEQAAREAS